jgi:hypothetical protein
MTNPDSGLLCRTTEASHDGPTEKPNSSSPSPNGYGTCLLSRPVAGSNPAGGTDDQAVEVWRSIPSTGGRYEASTRGRIRRADTGKVVKPRPCGKSDCGGGQRYFCIHLSLGSEGSRQATVHKLVAEAFLGPRPEGHHVDHCPGGRSDNSPGNLEYVTPRENMLRAYRAGRKLSGAAAAVAR